MKAVVAAFNQEKDLVGAFSVITNLRMELFEALVNTWYSWYIMIVESLDLGESPTVTGKHLLRSSGHRHSRGVFQ